MQRFLRVTQAVGGQRGVLQRRKQVRIGAQVDEHLQVFGLGRQDLLTHGVAFRQLLLVVKLDAVVSLLCRRLVLVDEVLQVVDNLLLSFSDLTGSRARQILLRIVVSFGLIRLQILQKRLIQSVLCFLSAGSSLKSIIRLRDQITRCNGQSDYRDCGANT